MTHSPTSLYLFNSSEQKNEGGEREAIKSRLAFLRHRKKAYQEEIHKLERTERALIEAANRLGIEDLFKEEA